MVDTNKKYDFSNTRCFIDFDSTIADSLSKYNIVLDSLVKGKLTDENYIEYYQDFGDAYDIIPGSPWRSILMNLVEYHGRNFHREIGSYNISRSRWYDVSATVDVGKYDALMLTVFDAVPAGNHPAMPVVYYKSDNASYTVILGVIPRIETIEAVACMPYSDTNILVTEDKEFVSDVLSKTKNCQIDDIMDIDDLADVLTGLFNAGCIELVPTLTYKELAIDPVIRFCKEYKAAGGQLIIHSGTNEPILLAMLDVLGIQDLFDDHLNSDMMTDADPSKLGAWGYKTELLNRLLEKYPVNGRRDVVIGDTKGDAYGAYEVGLPFLLVWRGYPKDPTKLKGAENDYLVPSDMVTVLQSELDEKPAEYFDDVVEQMLDFMKRVAEGEVPVLEHGFYE